MMIEPTPIDGCVVLVPSIQRDARGQFVKPFSRVDFPAGIFDYSIAEMFYSTSARGVVRGMHFQAPPNACSKLVTCMQGSIFDVMLDLRRDSATFGHTYCIALSATNGKAIVIPEGIAHGFQSLVDDSVVTYLQSASYRAESDAGVHFSSIGVEWPERVTQVSLRDQQHPAFNVFESPFC